MTSRERVLAALHHKTPDRVPRDLWNLAYVALFRQSELARLHQEIPSDIGRAELYDGANDATLQRQARIGTYTDEWGSVWNIAEPGIIGEVKAPALADWSKLATFQPPWELVRQIDMSHANRMCDASDRFMISPTTARPFERLQFVRGTEDTLIDLAYGTAKIFRLIEMIHEFYLADITNWANSNVDGVFFMDDWGSGVALLIDPAMWRAIFKPLYKQYCDILHAAGKYAFFHSDGNIEAIYGDLIEVGIDAINSQLFCMDIEELGRRYKGKITFWGEIDRQYVLPFGKPDEIRDAVRRVRRALDNGHGGVIAQCEWGKDNSADTIRTVFNAWTE